jgi:5'-3' exonuclease
MGIKHFWSWFRLKFKNNISELKKSETLAQNNIFIDNFMIDMNGLFHTSAQKVYEYGNFKRNRLLTTAKPVKINNFSQQMKLFKDVCETVDKALAIVKPRKRLILCVDGPAPLSKQNQQRKRRFMSAQTNDSVFDSNCITPGTKFTDHLTKYIDWHIRKKISENDELWKGVEVIFSNEKAPGEGEHKLFNYLRKYGNKEESYCIHGMDADLVMLSLGTHMPKFFILREEPMRSAVEFYAIDIGSVRQDMCDIMKWDEEKGRKFSKESAIDDFIFMCFTVGNDFLPHIPGIEIIEGAIDFMLDVYKNTCVSYGHLTRKTDKGVKFRRRSFSVFLGTVSQYEKGVLEDKLGHKDRFFPDPLLENNSTYVKGKYELDIVKYHKDYYAKNLSEIENKEELCHEYLDGMQMVLSYYLEGNTDWNWRYPYHYAPFADEISEYIKTYKFKVKVETKPAEPFIQLLCVLPPKSSELLPSPLNTLLSSDSSPLASYCPSKFEVDLSGKRQSWEGIVLLPVIDYEKVKECYCEYIGKVDEKERKRNMIGKSFVYFKGSKEFEFKSFYGDFTCSVGVRAIEL